MVILRGRGPEPSSLNKLRFPFYTLLMIIGTIMYWKAKQTILTFWHWRIRRMCGYAAIYAEYNDAAIAKAMEDNETLGQIIQSVPEKVDSLSIYQI